MLGTMGGNHRMDSTVISDAVNIASWIEGLTKIYGVSLLITDQTYERLQDKSAYAIRLIGREPVKGRTEEISVYEVFDADPQDVRERKLATKEMFEDACLLASRGDLENAMPLFEVCLSYNPQDPVVEYYIKRCQEIERSYDGE
jgi:hypothetical protein